MKLDKEKLNRLGQLRRENVLSTRKSLFDFGEKGYFTQGLGGEARQRKAEPPWDRRLSKILKQNTERGAS